MAILTPSNLPIVRFELTGLDEYLKEIEDAGRNIDEALKKAVEKAAIPAYEDIRKWAIKHKLTGATLEGVIIGDIKQEGNRTYVYVGIDTITGPESWHAVFVEYGTPTMPADPVMKKAFSKARIKRIMIEVLKEAGMPFE
jgi:HK97 gp10 family phage protein